jgi:hypothetical protein
MIKKIDRLVYQLFELTEEEIKIVEGEFPTVDRSIITNVKGVNNEIL